MKNNLVLIGLIAVMFLLAGCSNTGTLVMQITDAPAGLKIEKADMTLSIISVHMADAGEEEGWTTVVEGPLTFDLVAIKDVKELLGEKELAPGKYTQIRLSIDKAAVTIDGEEHELTVPSDKLKLTQGFDIAEGKTTTLTLDFDAQESIRETGKGEFKLQPTIKVIQE